MRETESFVLKSTFQQDVQFTSLLQLTPERHSWYLLAITIHSAAIHFRFWSNTRYYYPASPMHQPLGEEKKTLSLRAQSEEEKKKKKKKRKKNKKPQTK